MLLKHRIASVHFHQQPLNITGLFVLMDRVHYNIKHTHTKVSTETNLRKQACASTGRHVPDLIKFLMKTSSSELQGQEEAVCVHIIRPT